MMEEKYMRRAIELAGRGLGKVNPNPLVGAVIVKDGQVIGEGWHERYGGLHAERNAFANLAGDAEGAEMYVTLEPCCHHGKQPPCTDAIIEHGISRVYVGSDDPNALVAGKGIKMLRDAGIDVRTRVLKEECDALNPVFFHYITTKTPYVVMKYAMTLDGKTACHTGESRWVSSEQSRMRVQQTRNALSGIMVGVGTVLLDDPSLMCHLPEGRNPVRIICDSHLRTPLSAQVVQTAEEVSTVIATISSDQEQIRALKARGVQILSVKEQEGRIDLKDLMKKLGEQSVDGILLEGGGTLNASALEAGIVQHVQVYIAPKFFGGQGRYTPVTGPGADTPDQAWRCRNVKLQQIGEDVLLEYDVLGDSETW